MNDLGVKIKSKTDGMFEIEIQQMSSYAEIRSSIQQKLSKNKDFFTGSDAKLVLSGRALSDAQKKDLRRTLRMDYDIMNVVFTDEMEETVEQRKVSITHVPNRDVTGDTINLVSKNYFKAKSVFVMHTLHSGQRIECDGDVVVLGDVNDGAEVIAGGSIAVMGTLRGLVHAGAMGRSDVVVAANILKPKQLRISGKIGIFPEDNGTAEPEIAELKKGNILIKPMRPGKKKK